MPAKPSRLDLFMYNLDRAGASLMFRTSQETISSEVGRILIGAGKTDGWTPRFKWQARMAVALANWLNRNPQWWGPEHTKNAILHADELDHADDGREQ